MESAREEETERLEAETGDNVDKNGGGKARRETKQQPHSAKSETTHTQETVLTHESCREEKARNTEHRWISV